MGLSLRSVAAARNSRPRRAFPRLRGDKFRWGGERLAASAPRLRGGSPRLAPGSRLPADFLRIPLNPSRDGASGGIREMHLLSGLNFNVGANGAIGTAAAEAAHAGLEMNQARAGVEMSSPSLRLTPCQARRDRRAIALLRHQVACNEAGREARTIMRVNSAVSEASAGLVAPTGRAVCPPATSAGVARPMANSPTGAAH